MFLVEIPCASEVGDLARPAYEGWRKVDGKDHEERRAAVELLRRLAKSRSVAGEVGKLAFLLRELC